MDASKPAPPLVFEAPNALNGDRCLLYLLPGSWPTFLPESVRSNELCVLSPRNETLSFCPQCLSSLHTSSVDLYLDSLLLVAAAAIMLALGKRGPSRLLWDENIAILSLTDRSDLSSCLHSSPFDVNFLAVESNSGAAFLAAYEVGQTARSILGGPVENENNELGNTVRGKDTGRGWTILPVSGSGGGVSSFSARRSSSMTAPTSL